MNVIIANKRKEMLMSLDIEVIKSLEGEYEPRDLIEMFDNFFFDRMILDITSIKNYKALENIQALSIGIDMSKVILVLDDSSESEQKGYLSKLISMGIYNFTKNINGINYLLSHPHVYKDVAHLHNLNEVEENTNPEVKIVEKIKTVYNNQTEYVESPKLQIIGVKNITENAGSTSLIYMMYKELLKNYKVVAIEYDKRDFPYFNEDMLISTTDLPKEFMKYQSYDVMLIDLNNYEDDSVCAEVLYLIEPTTLKLNKLMMRNQKVFEQLKGKKIILNRCNLSSTEVSEFEYESKSSVFYKLPCLDDRKHTHKEIQELLAKLGLNRVQ